MKKLTATILIAALVLGLCGCDTQPEPQSSVLGAYGDTQSEQKIPTVTKTDMSLLFYDDMDTNPVTTTCLANSDLLKLVYSPLIRLSESFSPYCVLARDYAQNGNEITVTLREALVFSDGTALTADDVVKSFLLAKKTPDSPYFRQANCFSSIQAANSSTVVFRLLTPVAEPLALLDVPVMKNGQAGVGCGPYVFSEKNGKNVLTINENYFERPSVPLIYLLETKDDANITSLFSSGVLDVISLSAIHGLSLTSLRDYSIVSYPSNNFIYIGVNYNNPLLAQESARQALSACIDRAKLVSQSLVGLGDGTIYPLNPNWYKLSGINCCPDYSQKSVESAAQTLQGAVFNMIIPANSDIKSTIAAAVAENLKSAGVTLNITELEGEQFDAALASGTYDLYIGETALSRTMNPDCLYSTGGTLNTAGYYSEELDGAFSRYTSGELTIGQYLELFSARLPVIPVMFCKNVIYCDNNITGFTSQSPWNSLGDFTKVTFK